MSTTSLGVSELYTSQLAKRNVSMKNTSTMGKGRGRGKPKPRPRPKG